jgi:hypothetical protein
MLLYFQRFGVPGENMGDTKTDVARCDRDRFIGFAFASVDLPLESRRDLGIRRAGGACAARLGSGLHQGLAYRASPVHAPSIDFWSKEIPDLVRIHIAAPGADDGAGAR